MNKKQIAELILFLSTLLWALTYACTRILVREIHPNILIFWRGLLAALILSLFAFSSIKESKEHLFKIIFGGFLMGALFYIAYVTQAIGLQTIESGRSAFITSLYIVFVPLMSPLFNGTRPTKHNFIACSLALGGLFLLTNPISQHGFYRGDVWTLIAALAFAIQIHLLQVYTQKYASYDFFVFLQTLTIGILAAMSIPFTVNTSAITWFPHSLVGIIAILYLIIFTTVITMWLQSRYQKDTSAEKASLIYALEPVFAIVFGYFILHEIVSISALIGACLMILAAIWVEIVRGFNHYSQKENIFNILTK